MTTHGRHMVLQKYMSLILDGLGLIKRIEIIKNNGKTNWTIMFVPDVDRYVEDGENVVDGAGSDHEARIHRASNNPVKKKIIEPIGSDHQTRIQRASNNPVKK